MTEQEQDLRTGRKLIKFSISLSWDGFGGKSVWVWVPDDWEIMSEDEREKFMRAEANIWFNEYAGIELDWRSYDSWQEAYDDSGGSWSSKANEKHDLSNVESWWD